MYTLNKTINIARLLYGYMDWANILMSDFEED